MAIISQNVIQLRGTDNVEDKIALPIMERNVNEAFFKVSSAIDELRTKAASGVFEWSISGELATGTVQDGFRFLDRPAVLKKVTVLSNERGNSGVSRMDVIRYQAGTIGRFKVDVKGRSVFASDGDRPQIIGLTSSPLENYISEVTTFNDTALNANDMLSWDVLTATVSGPQDIVMRVLVEYTE